MKTSILYPSSDLSAFIDYFWTLEADSSYAGTSEFIYPQGCPELIFHWGNPFISCELGSEKKLQPTSLLCSQKLSSYSSGISGKTAMMSVVFKPFGASAFINADLTMTAM